MKDDRIIIGTPLLPKSPNLPQVLSELQSTVTKHSTLTLSTPKLFVVTSL